MRELTGTRRLIRRFEPGARALILLYHRIDTPTTDPWTLAVSPERFDEQLAVLAQRFHPITLTALVDAVIRRRVPSRAVAVTFDDGYADNLQNGVPLLKKHSVPAIFYVTAGHIAATREFWWKQVEQLFLEPHDLPRRLEVEHPALRWSWTLDHDASYPSELVQRYHSWRVNDTPPTARHGAFLSLLAILEPLQASVRDDILAELFSTCGVERRRRDAHRMLATDEVRELADADGMTIGAHTVTHARLASESAVRQETEIRDSKTQLESIVDRNVIAFAYPFGEARDFDFHTVQLVRAAGYSNAVAVRDLAISRSSPLFALPRVGIIDWDGDEFERHLEWWLRRGL